MLSPGILPKGNLFPNRFPKVTNSLNSKRVWPQPDIFGCSGWIYPKRGSQNKTLDKLKEKQKERNDVWKTTALIDVEVPETPFFF